MQSPVPPGRPQQQQPQKRTQVGLDKLPGQNSPAQPAQRRAEQAASQAAAAVSQLGLGERVQVNSPIPVPSMALVQDDAPQWQDPNATSQEQPEAQPETVQPKADIPRVRSSEHPLVAALRLEFGLDQIKTVDTKIGKMLWRQRILNHELSTYAMRVADTLSTTISEHTMKLSIARACCSVVAVSSDEKVFTPLYEMFNVKLNSDEDFVDKFNPPARVQKLAAGRLYDLVMFETKDKLGPKLAESYDDKLEALSEVSSDLNMNTVYECPVCGNTKKYPDRKTDGGERQPYYCELDGAVMVPSLTSEEASSSPLA